MLPDLIAMHHHGYGPELGMGSHGKSIVFHLNAELLKRSEKLGYRNLADAINDVLVNIGQETSLIAVNSIFARPTFLF